MVVGEWFVIYFDICKIVFIGFIEVGKWVMVGVVV